MNRRIVWYSTAAILAIGLLWFRGDFDRDKKPKPIELTVFAAASTIDAMEEVLAAFPAYIEGIGMGDTQSAEEFSLKVNYASSSSLRLMIANGAEPVLFLSAREEPNSTDLLSNRLVAIKRIEDAEPMSLRDFRGRIAMGDPKHVPAGQYAKRFLEKAGQWEQIQPIAGSDVRQVLAMICNGAADVGIVYATDAMSVNKKVRVVYEFDDPEIPVTYTVSTTSNKRIQWHESKLLDFVQSDEAKAIFIRHGFTPIND